MGVAILAGFIATMLAAPMSFADVIWIPMATKVDKLKLELKEHGIDLYGTDESDGYVENLGTKIKIVTNRWMEDDEMELIKEAAVNARR